MYDIVLESGETFGATGEHRLWNGSSYVCVEDIAEEFERITKKERSSGRN